FQKLQPAELHEWDVAPYKFDFERRAVMRGAEQHGLRLEPDAHLSTLQHLLHHEASLVRLIANRDELRSFGRGPVAPQFLAVPLGSQSDYTTCRRKDKLSRTV